MLRSLNLTRLPGNQAIFFFFPSVLLPFTELQHQIWSVTLPGPIPVLKGQGSWNNPCLKYDQGNALLAKRWPWIFRLSVQELSHSGPDQKKPTVQQALTLWTTPIHAYEMNVMAELVYTQPLFSILFSTISFLWDASTSLVFWGKAGPCPSSWLLLFFSWQTAPSFNRGSGEGYNTFRVCERPYLPSKWRFPDTPTLFSYALKSLMRN